MSRLAQWRAASVILLGGLAARAVWLAWQYYIDHGPRYRVESAMIALVIAAVTIAAIRRGEAASDHATVALPRFWLLVSMAAAVALYARAIGLGFLSDDYALRALAQSGSVGADAGWFFRPLPLLVWRGLLTVADTPALLHVLNILLHGLNAGLVAMLGCAMGMRRDLALGAAALFLAFPALPEAVAWTAGIQDVLMTTMALAAVVAAARRPLSGRQIALVCVLLVLGLLSKETAICIPLLIALCWFTPSRAKAEAPLYASVVVIAIVYLAIRIPMGIGSDYFGEPSRYFFKQLIVVAFGTLAAPWRTPVAGAESVVALTAVLAVVVLLVHAGLTWSRGDPRLHRGVRLTLWVLASIAPVFTLFFVGPNLEGARYLYLASGAWSLVIVDLIASVTDRITGGARVYALVIAGCVCVFALSVQRELGVWQRAADLRDQVLRQARAAMNGAQCSNPSFSNVPDSVDGAYVFRNGFPQALALSASEAGSGCTFRWSDGRFVQSR
jgi:hypothetical protein